MLAWDLFRVNIQRHGQQLVGAIHWLIGDAGRPSTKPRKRPGSAFTPASASAHAFA